MINLASFSRSFPQNLKALEKAEGTVKEKLAMLANDSLRALHEHGNITFCNRLVRAKLTPMNKKTLVLFFQAFTGFHFDQEKTEFTKKNKKQYEEKKTAILGLLDDLAFNIWVWAEQAVEVQAVAWTPDKITKYLDSALKKADKEGYKQSDVIAAILQSGIDPAELLAVLDTLQKEEPLAA